MSKGRRAWQQRRGQGRRSGPIGEGVRKGWYEGRAANQEGQSSRAKKEAAEEVPESVNTGRQVRTVL